MAASLNRLTRGFTGHEHLENPKHPDGAIGLIHMNGRVYDPELGVFLSADPLVQFPHSTQGLNRYAYVGNNPLSYTDPSGHLIFGLIAAAIMVKVESWVVATVIAAVAGYLDTGSLKSAFFSGLSAGLGFGVGDFVKTMGFESAFAVGFATATTHGLIQGSISAAQGGRFGSGAMAGFAGSVLGQKGGRPPSLAGAIRAVVVGGTVSRIGGGKFANGAAMASFSYTAAAFSQGGDLLIDAESSQTVKETKQTRHNLEVSIVENGGYPTNAEAALAGYRASDDLYIASAPNEEFVFLTVKNDTTGRYHYTTGAMVGANNRVTFQVANGDGYSYAGHAHTHPYTRRKSQEMFSAGDNVSGRAAKTYPRFLRTDLSGFLCVRHIMTTRRSRYATQEQEGRRVPGAARRHHPA